MLIGHTHETCPIIIFITDRGAQCVKICVHITFLMAGWRQMKTGERAHVCDVCVWLAVHTEAVFCFFVFVLFFPSDKTV